MVKTFGVAPTLFGLLAAGSVLSASIDEPGSEARPTPPLGGFDQRLLTSTASVQLDWARNYVSGFSPQFDYPEAMVVDPSGNILVTGGSWGANQLPDMTTIKYDGTGDTLWVRRHDGPGNNWDDGRVVATDPDGNVYVTGWSYSDAHYFDYVTIKYDASGARQWVAQYNGGEDNDDRAVAMAIDASGNVYVTGTSYGTGTADDYATVKYDHLGQEQWVARYNGPGNTQDRAAALALDGEGNVYVTGASGEGSSNLSDYVTVKYDSSGVQQWVGRYSDWYDYATAMDVDARGNVYVTGYSFHPGTFYDYATVKYNAMGVQQWVRRYNGPGGSDDLAYALEVDDSGNVFVTGEAFFESATGTDYATIKYSPSGVEKWVRRYDGPGNAVDIAYALALDESGDVYVTGGSRGADLVDDFATIKYSSSGDEQWVARSGDGGDTYDIAEAIAVDAGNVYVTGYSSKTGSKLWTTLKYAPIGVVGVEPPDRVPGPMLASPNPVRAGDLVSLRVGASLPVEVFSPTGRRILSSRVDTRFRAASPGVYLVRAGAQVQKLVVVGR